MDFRVFSATKLHAALSEAGDGPSFRTVRRWVEGKATPSTAEERTVRALIGAPGTDAPPGWAVGMEKRIRLELRLTQALIESEVTPDEIEAMRAELHAETPDVQLPGAGSRQADQRPLGRGPGTPR